MMSVSYSRQLTAAGEPVATIVWDAVRERAENTVKIGQKPVFDEAVRRSRRPVAYAVV